MRTTLTLDGDVWKRLQAEARRTGQPFRDLVNGHLRDSLARRRLQPAAPPFQVVPVDLGGPAPGRSDDDIAGLLDAALAALAIEQGATLVSTDADSLRFEGLKRHDPSR